MSRIEWVESRLELTHDAVRKLKEVGCTKAKILICSHLEAKLIAFSKMLHHEGHEVHLISNLPTSIKREHVQEIKEMGLTFYDTSDYSFEDSELLISKIMNTNKFDFVFDDGAHTYSKLNQKVRTVFTEFTQSGINFAGDTQLNVLVVNLNSSYTKRVVGNIYGTGISTLAAIQTMININFHKLNVGIIGLGPIGLSCALAFRGAGANVYSYDLKNELERRATKNGIHFVPKETLLDKCELIITCTGKPNAIKKGDFAYLRDRAILANVGHYNHEIEYPVNESCSIAENVEEFNINGRRIYLLAKGNLVNLSMGMGYPIEIIDASFAASVYAWIEFKDSYDVGLVNYPTKLDDTYFKELKLRYEDLT